jgi:hypothetical protein
MDSEGERQATALKCWTDRSQSAIRFQLVKFRVTIFSSALSDGPKVDLRERQFLRAACRVDGCSW